MKCDSPLNCGWTVDHWAIWLYTSTRLIVLFHMTVYLYFSSASHSHRATTTPLVLSDADETKRQYLRLYTISLPVLGWLMLAYANTPSIMNGEYKASPSLTLTQHYCPSSVSRRKKATVWSNTKSTTSWRFNINLHKPSRDEPSHEKVISQVMRWHVIDCLTCASRTVCGRCHLP